MDFCCIWYWWFANAGAQLSVSPTTRYGLDYARGGPSCLFFGTLDVFGGSGRFSCERSSDGFIGNKRISTLVDGKISP